MMFIIAFGILVYGIIEYSELVNEDVNQNNELNDEEMKNE